MKWRVSQVCTILLLLPFICSAEGLQLFSVTPAVTGPGQSIQIMGEGFSPATRVLLGDRQLVPELLSSGQLRLEIPELEEGQFSLRLADEVMASVQTLSLRVEFPPPRIDSLSPSNINECSTEVERQVTIRGRNFQPGLKLLLNGAAVPAQVESDQDISFDSPQLTAGIYGLQVINPNGKQSLPHSLYFTNIPKIYSWSEGEDYVSSYQVVIEGKNFYPHSTLVIREYAGFNQQPPQQRVITARGAGRDGDGSRLRVKGDYLNYVDCNTLIYYRFPYSGQAKELTMQVINRDGKTSSIEQAFLP